MPRPIVAERGNEFMALSKYRNVPLYAKIKLPGKAWLEFKIDETNGVAQKITFLPLGFAWGLTDMPCCISSFYHQRRAP
ncbi:hypothetical protein MTO98_30640 [Mucilaginibacter sp. SMC90]|uniref:Uncharacterized protein n=1 Tax=Mucilaginibacter rubeus TaxID=2027860 RepID=A0A5C1I530_9SPHI|nr:MULTISPECIES: hypothetical protein [Mucilaginibacter]QEM12440.1 hypothetical protein DEO27_021260 [Mucilaginibacter rubeus]UOE48760.1 hypothetical protein MTO98_30640 [Mucilaginibacter sp. SMC90]